MQCVTFILGEFPGAVDLEVCPEGQRVHGSLVGVGVSHQTVLAHHPPAADRHGAFAPRQPEVAHDVTRQHVGRRGIGGVPASVHGADLRAAVIVRADVDLKPPE